MEIMFENYDRKIDKINAALNEYGIKDLEEAYEICKAKGLDPYQTAKSIQPSASRTFAGHTWQEQLSLSRRAR